MQNQRGRPESWPAERTERLRALAPVMTVDAVAAALGVGRGAVASKARRLGIAINGGATPVWTPERDALLIALAPTSTCSAVAARLETTHDAVSSRARRLGVSFRGGSTAPPPGRPSAWSAEHLATLARLAPDHTAEQIGAALGKTRSAVCGRAHRDGIAIRASQCGRVVMDGARRRPAPRPAAAKAFGRSAIAAPEPEPRRIALAELRLDADCRWLLEAGDAGPIYCGAPRGGSPEGDIILAGRLKAAPCYCLAHALAATRPSSRAKRLAADSKALNGTVAQSPTGNGAGRRPHSEPLRAW